MSVRYEPDPLGLAESAPTVRPGLVRLLDATERTATAERLLGSLEKAAKQSRAPVAMEGGLKVFWWPSSAVHSCGPELSPEGEGTAAGFLYYTWQKRLTREDAVRWLFERIGPALR